MMRSALLILATICAAEAAPHIYVTNFAASANYRGPWHFSADLQYNNATASCASESQGRVTKCAGITDGIGEFSSPQCTTHYDDETKHSAWTWHIREHAYDKRTMTSGFELEVVYDGDKSTGRIYGCRFFDINEAECDPMHAGFRGAHGVTGQRLVVAPTFTLKAQTTSGCLPDKLAKVKETLPADPTEARRAGGLKDTMQSEEL